jgi:hypothetical protein
VEQGLRGDAADVHANTTQSRILFDEGNFFAFVGGIKRRRVASRPGA